MQGAGGEGILSHVPSKDLLISKFGGADEIRTHDLCSAIAALSHLSYSPIKRLFTGRGPGCQRSFARDCWPLALS